MMVHVVAAVVAAVIVDVGDGAYGCDGGRR